MSNNESDLNMTRLWLIAACVVMAMFTSCTANSFYQERTFKETAIAKGMNATQTACAWSGGESARCVVRAVQAK